MCTRYKSDEKIGKFINRRREMVKKYNEAFRNLKDIITPYEADYSNSGWHIYVIRLNLDALTVWRKERFEALQKENIGVNVHYITVYLHPYYEKLGYKKELCLEAEKAYESMITFPLFPKMTEKDIKDVMDAINKVVTYYRK